MSVDHLAAMQAALAEQFKGLPNLGAFVTAIGNQFNDIEEFFGQLLTNVVLENAVGVQLDNLGAALTQGRNGLADSAYRTLLQAKVVALQSDGTVENLIQILLTMGGATQVQLLDTFPAGFQASVVGLGTSVSSTDLHIAMTQARQAGVGMNLVGAVLPVFCMDRPASAIYAGMDVGHVTGPII